MKFIKQYPYISSLLIFSSALFVIGIYAAFIMSLEDSGINRRYKSNGSGIDPGYVYKVKPPVADAPVSEPEKYNNPSISIIKQTGTAKATYYRSSDSTITQTDYFPFRKVDSAEFTLVASFEHPGFTLEVPEEISLRLVLLSKDNSYANNRAFKIFQDGRLVFNKESELEDSVFDKNTKVFNISLNQLIPYDAFVNITKGDSIQLLVGKSLIYLDEREIQGLRDLVELVEGETPGTNANVKVEAPPPPRQERREVLRPAH